MNSEANNLVVAVFIVLLSMLTAASNTPSAIGRGTLYTVDDIRDTHDILPGDGICADVNNRCTLRAAIEESNTTVDRDAIVFDLPQPSIITLDLGELVVSRSLHVAGPGARRLTIQRSTEFGTSNFRVFRFANERNISSIRGLSIRNGSDEIGGGVLIDALHLVEISDCRLSDNSATNGGAIAVNGSRLVLLRSLTFSNVASERGGGLYLTGSKSNINVINSTLTGNSASTGGAIYNDGPLVLINNTISQNFATASSSSIRNINGAVRVMNTIIGRDNEQAVTALSGKFISAGNNIITDARNSTGFVNGINADQVSDNNEIEPLLGHLADNGGQTDSFHLLANSPAVDRGNPCVVNGICNQLPGVATRGTTDQRRVVRPNLFGAVPDIGAFELIDIPSFVRITTLLVNPSAPPVTRFVNSPVVLTNTRTLEKKTKQLNVLGHVIFPQVRMDDDYIVEIKAKRSGIVTPVLYTFD